MLGMTYKNTNTDILSQWIDIMSIHYYYFNIGILIAFNWMSLILNNKGEKNDTYKIQSRKFGI